MKPIRIVITSLVFEGYNAVKLSLSRDVNDAQRDITNFLLVLAQSNCC
jgi:hypothetical protein